MGIHGLWQVLEPTGRPVNIHSLRGKILAIDVSIWLHQLVKGFRDKDGNPLPNAHLLGVFHRVCKLLNYGIKPVFVFDGGVPVLKRQTLAARRQRKLESLDKAELSRQKILSAYLQQQLQRQVKIALPPSLRMQAQIDALSSGAKKSPFTSPKKRKITTASSSLSMEDISSEDNKVDEDLETFRAALIAKLEDDMEEDSKKDKTDSDDEELPANAYHYGVDYSENFSMIQAPEFDTLPLETQHEILFEMQESRKMNSWGKFDKMPKDLQSFSSYQMERLVKRRDLQKKIKSVQQEMGQRHIHVQNLDDLLKMDYNNFDDKDTEIIGSKDDGFVLITAQTPPKGKVEKEEPKAGTSASSSLTKTPEVITIDDYIIEDSSSDTESMKKQGKLSESSQNIEMTQPQPKSTSVLLEEEDADLKLAIELSLKDSVKTDTSHYNNSAVENKVSNLLTDAEKSSHGEALTQIYTNHIMDHITEGSRKFGNSQEEEEEEQPLCIESSQMSHCAKFLDTIGYNLPQAKAAEKNPKTHFKNSIGSACSSHAPIESFIINEVNARRSEPESESDDDFEEVEVVEKPSCLSTTQSLGQNDTVVTIDLAAIKNSAVVDDDIFADIFSEEAIKPEEENETYKANKSETANIVNEVVDASGSPNKVSDEVQWDSESEIEADLLEMVMQESAASTHLQEQQKMSADHHNHQSPTSEKHSYVNIEDQRTKAAATNVIVEQAGDEEAGTSKQVHGGPMRMITADYMQAQEQLNVKLGKLHSEMGQQERVATSISDQMQIETQELISLFGIPYLVSPTEAESQCAFLDKACLTEGTITDDSDVWLFGGQRVYKNFFSQGQKHVELYQAADIQRVLNLSREKLIELAMMIGSDYSDGIQGVGPVLALEILCEFTSVNIESFETLLRFREWWDEVQTKPVDLFSGSKLKEKLRKLKLRPGFPNKTVYDAFINPSIDQSTESFKWGNPDLDAIRNYTKQKFGWEQSKCDSLLLPVLRKRQCELDQSRQLTLDAYISFGKMPSLAGGKRKKTGSKRIQTAVKRLKRVGVESHELNLSSDSDSDVEIKKTSERTTLRKRVTNPVVAIELNQEGNSFLSGEKVHKRKKPGESATAASSTTKATSSSVSTNVNRLTLKKPEMIPQRVQAQSDKMKSKQKAIEIFKKRLDGNS